MGAASQGDQGLEKRVLLAQAYHDKVEGCLLVDGEFHDQGELVWNFANIEPIEVPQTTSLAAEYLTLIESAVLMMCSVSTCAVAARRWW